MHRVLDDGKVAKTFTECGKLVPDELVTRLVFNELNGRPLNSSSWLLDGFPRNLQQARSLADLVALSKVIDLHVPHDEIIGRVKGRLIHEPSGRVYNSDYSPPATPMTDDVTGEPLVQRDDDRPEVVAVRLANHEKLMAPIREFYEQRGLLVKFTGTSSKKIYADIKKYLDTVIDKPLAIDSQLTH